MNTLIRVFLIAVSLGAIVLISLAVTQETYKKYQIQKEIEELRAQAEKKERENEKLKGLIEYFKTNDFQEKEAKEQLSLQKEGEKVIVVKEENKEEEKKGQEDEAGENQNSSQKDERENYQKWWDYFFAY